MGQAITVYQPKVPALPLERQIARRIDADIPYYLTEAESRAMVDATSKARDRLLLLTMWNTGGRVSEVVRLRRSDFDYHHLRLANLKQKRRSEKLVYVAPTFAVELLEYCERQGIGATDYLFQAKRSGKPISARMARRIFYDASRRAGVVKLKAGEERPAWPHTARHGNAVALVRAGVPLKVVREQLGHASLLTTERYLIFSEQDKVHFISQAMG